MLVLKRIAITLTVILAFFGMLFVYGLYRLATDGLPSTQEPMQSVEQTIECPDVQYNCM